MEQYPYNQKWIPIEDTLEQVGREQMSILISAITPCGGGSEEFGLLAVRGGVADLHSVYSATRVIPVVPLQPNPDYRKDWNEGQGLLF